LVFLDVALFDFELIQALLPLVHPSAPDVTTDSIVAVDRN
jgi:hypothetical protein